MNKIVKRNTAVIVILVLVSLATLLVLSASCHAGDYSLCLLVMCAFILTTASVFFTLGANPLMFTIPANRGISIPIRLDRPPRT